jgi:hypothetical protein
VEENPALVRRARSRGLWVKGINELCESDSAFDVVIIFSEINTALLFTLQQRVNQQGRMLIKSVTTDPEKVLQENGWKTVKIIRRSDHTWYAAMRK